MQGPSPRAFSFHNQPQQPQLICKIFNEKEQGTSLLAQPPGGSSTFYIKQPGLIHTLAWNTLLGPLRLMGYSDWRRKESGWQDAARFSNGRIGIGQKFRVYQIIKTFSIFNIFFIYSLALAFISATVRSLPRPLCSLFFTLTNLIEYL